MNIFLAVEVDNLQLTKAHFFNKIAQKNNSSESEDEENVLINIDSNPGSTLRKRIFKKRKGQIKKILSKCDKVMTFSQNEENERNEELAKDYGKLLLILFLREDGSSIKFLAKFLD
jgi:predicted lactoylglutathione lyase